MSKATPQPFCPCGSGRLLLACCGPYLDRCQDPPTAAALMRSRYTAFVRRDADYLLATWDPAHRPPHLSLKQDRTEWLGLQIVETEAGRETDVTGRVHFIARFRLDGKEQALAENSRFQKIADRWLYLDGEIAPSAKPVSTQVSAARPSTGRNEPCPCGSGMKFKRCCGK